MNRCISRGSLLAAAILMVPVVAAAQGLDTARVDQALGRSGQKMGAIYKVGFPRTDLHVTLHGVTIRPGLALGSWAAFSGMDTEATVMGDLVLLQDEIAPVMQKLRAGGFEVTALHNHLLDEIPHVMYMHYMGHGAAATLASTVRAALAASKTPLGKPAAAAPSSAAPPAWVAVAENALGRKGAFSGGVLAIGVPRRAAVMMGGTALAPSQGVAESMNVQDAGGGKVATTGDFVLTADEVNPVISALEAHGIQVTAIHNHMLDDQPRLFFMHFWVVASPAAVGSGLRDALSHVATE
jgi:Domain of Unknown Function (DUF1259)